MTDPLDWICTDCVGANPEELAGRAPDAEEIDLAFMVLHHKIKNIKFHFFQLGNLTDADAGDRSQAPTVVREVYTRYECKKHASHHKNIIPHLLYCNAQALL